MLKTKQDRLMKFLQTFTQPKLLFKAQEKIGLALNC